MDGYEVRTLHLARTCKYGPSSCINIHVRTLHLKRTCKYGLSSCTNNHNTPL